MSIFDDILSRVSGHGSLASMVTSNPKIMSAVASLLSSEDTSVGGSGGLTGLIRMFQGKGLGDVVSSWVGQGPNKEISEAQVVDVLGDDTMKQFASKAGIGAASAGTVLSGLLPVIVNHITPQGKAPEGDALESALKPLLEGMPHAEEVHRF